MNIDDILDARCPQWRTINHRQLGDGKVRLFVRHYKDAKYILNKEIGNPIKINRIETDKGDFLRPPDSSDARFTVDQLFQMKYNSSITTEEDNQYEIEDLLDILKDRFGFEVV
jgi:hypothetical protein